jgi:(S)-mandelate dehydrogenase
MNLDQAVNIEDLHRMAKRRLPKIAFDFIEGGLEDERDSSATPATPRRFTRAYLWQPPHL